MTDGREPAASEQSKLHVALALLAVCAITWLAFSPMLDNGFTDWDDDGYITESEYIDRLDESRVREIFTTGRIFSNYHPLTILSFAVNHHFSGFDPYAYHATNLVLHVLNTALVFAWIWQLSRGRLEIAAIVSVLFAIHPMHVESVAWASSRKDVLYGLFFLLSLIGYGAYTRAADGARRSIFYALVTLCFGASLLSKPAAVVLPVALLLVDYAQRRPWSHALWIEKLPWLAMSLLLGLQTLRAQSESAIADPLFFTFAERISIASYGFVMYLAKLLVPVQLSSYYPYPDFEAGMPAAFALAPLAALAIAAGAAIASRRSRVIAFGSLWFAISIALVLQFVSVGSAVMADRYTYLAYLGPFWIVAHRACEFSRKGSVAPRAIALGALCAVVAMFAVGTYQRCFVWKDTETLWTDVIRKHPDRAWLAHNNRGVHYRESEQFDHALADFDRAIAIRADYADAFSNRGNVHFARNRDDDAIADYSDALRFDPGHAKAHANRGAARNRRGDRSQALEDFRAALELDADYANTYLNRAQLYLDTRQFESAIDDLDRYIKRDAGNAEAYEARGLARQQLRQHREALQDFDRALKLSPGDGLLQLRRSFSFDALEQPDRALDAARHAQQLDAQVPSDYLARLTKIASTDRGDAQLAALQTAIEREPDEASHRDALAAALVARGDTQQAERVLRDAIARWPCELSRVSELANLSLRNGRGAQVQVLEDAAARCGSPPEILNDLAYLLASAYEDDVRDAPRALALAQQAVAAFGEHPLVLDTLAVALGANGRFEDAVRTSRNAVKSAAALSLPESDLENLRAHLTTLEAGTPVRQ